MFTLLCSCMLRSRNKTSGDHMSIKNWGRERFMTETAVCEIGLSKKQRIFHIVTFCIDIVQSGEWSSVFRGDIQPAYRVMNMEVLYVILGNIRTV